MRKKGFTLIELLVVIAIIAMLLAILMPALSKVKKIAQRVVCATNLKGLGTAQHVYSQDYEDEFAVQGGRGEHEWDFKTIGFQALDLNFNPGGNATTKTIGASLYLLVREADVSPKNFVCPSGDETEYDGTNGKERDIVELYDFGNEEAQGAEGSGYPHEHVSYAYQMPYNADGGKGSYIADGSGNASFAVMADKNPYLDPKISELTGASAQNWQDRVQRMGNYFATSASLNESSWQIKVANSYTHGRDGQNVVYVDGHASFEKVSDVGVQNNAIYVMDGGSGDDEQKIRQGSYNIMSSAGVHDLTNLQPEGSRDSLLLNDDVHDAANHP